MGPPEAVGRASGDLFSMETVIAEHRLPLSHPPLPSQQHRPPGQAHPDLSSKL